MSSARMLLAAVASGLAACAYTPTKNVTYLPETNRAAPVLMVNATVPTGYNDHVMIVVNHDGIALPVTDQPGFQPYGATAYPYVYSFPSQRPVSLSDTRPVSTPATSSDSRPVGRPTITTRSVRDNVSSRRATRYSNR